MYTILIIVFLLSHLKDEKSKISENQGIILKSTLRSTYEILGDKNGNEITYYFLIEVKLVNNSNSSLEFLTQMCTTGANIVIDSKDINLFVNNCSNNSITKITLNPKQEFSVIEKFYSKEKDLPDKIKIGWIMFPTKKDFYSQNFYEVLNMYKKSLENVIWSEPLELHYAGGKTFDIK